MQSGIAQSHFDWISGKAFDIRDCTRAELDKHVTSLPPGWNVTEEMMNAGKGGNDTTNVGTVYLKICSHDVDDFTGRCNTVIDAGTNNYDKGLYKQFLRDMKPKSGDEQHNIHYTGETVRSTLKRQLEHYPENLERLGVTHRFQVGQVDESSLDWSGKIQGLVFESTVAMTLEATSNKAAFEKDKEYKLRSFSQLGCANKSPCGNVPQRRGHGINQFCKDNCGRYGDKRVVDVTSDPEVLGYKNQFLYLIARANGKAYREDYEPTVYEFSVGWGTMMLELELGIFNKKNMPIAKTNLVGKNGEIIVHAGDRYDNYGQVGTHNLSGVHMTNKLLQMTAVIEKQCHVEVISELESLDGVSFEGGSQDHDDFELLKKKCGNNLLKKLKEAANGKLKEMRDIQRMAADLHDICGDYTNLGSLKGVNFTGPAAKCYKTQSIKYEDDELLDKLKEFHRKRMNDTVTFDIDLTDLLAGKKKMGFHFDECIDGSKKSLRTSEIGQNSLGSEAFSVDSRFDGGKVKLTMGMELKCYNGHNVEGTAEVNEVLPPLWEEAKANGQLKLEMYSILNYRDVGPKF